MIESLRRALGRPSGRLARAVLIPLSLLYVAVAAYAALVAVKAANTLDTRRLLTTAETLARSWDERADSGALARIAAVEGWDRVWIVSATGRILASSWAGEAGSAVDPLYWDGLQDLEGSVVRTVRRSGAPWLQAAFRDVERGRWAVIITSAGVPGVPAGVRVAAIGFLAIVVWLLTASAVLVVVHRRLGRGYDLADDLARRILDGEEIPASRLARECANLAREGVPSRILALAARLQEQADRSREAESRFASAIEVAPGAAYVASFDGRLLVVGGGFRRRMPDPARPLQGHALSAVDGPLPLSRIHELAARLRDARLTVDRMPVAADGGDVLVSIRPVRFRGMDGYLAHVENPDEAAAAGDPAGSSVARDLLDVSEDLVVAFDAEARTILWNRTAERLTGRSRHEVPDLKRVVGLLLPDRESTARFTDWLEAQPGAGTLDVPVRAQTGETLEVRWSAHELTSEGAVIGGALVGRPASRAEVGPPPEPGPARSRKASDGPARSRKASAGPARSLEASDGPARSRKASAGPARSRKAKPATETRRSRNEEKADRPRRSGKPGAASDTGGAASGRKRAPKASPAALAGAEKPPAPARGTESKSTAGAVQGRGSTPRG